MPRCECCGAPVDDDGRYKRPDGGKSVTEDERYERDPRGTSVTEGLARLRARAEERRKKYPHGYPGSEKWWRHRRGHETGCVICGEDLPKNSGKYYKRVAPHRMYCSNACRQKAYRIRKRVTNDDHGGRS